MKRSKASLIVAGIFLIVIFWMLSLLLTGCGYPESKARSQFSRAAAAFPIIPAEYCAQTYPVKEKVITGKDSVRVDTLWADSSSTTVVRDTIRFKDTVIIQTVKILPGKTIRETFIRTDTVYKENTAALDACNIALRSSVINLEKANAEWEKWMQRAKLRWWIIAALITVLGLGIFFLLWRKFKKP